MELGEGLDGPSWMLEFTGGPLVRASWAMKEAGRLRGELLARMTQWATWRMLGDGPYRAWWASRAAARDLPARYRSEAEVDDWPFFGDRNAWYEVLLRGGVLREEVRAWILRSAAGGATWHYLDAIFMRDRAHTTEVAELAFRSERFIDAVASIDSARSPSQGGHGRSSHALEVETRILLWLGRYRDALRISAGAATPERLRACVRWGEPRAASEALSAWESSSRGSLSGEGGVSAFTEHHILLGIEMPGAISFRGEHPSWEQGSSVLSMLSTSSSTATSPTPTRTSSTAATACAPAATRAPSSNIPPPASPWSAAPLPMLTPASGLPSRASANSSASAATSSRGCSPHAVTSACGRGATRSLPPTSRSPLTRWPKLSPRTTPTSWRPSSPSRASPTAATPRPRSGRSPRWC